MTELYRAHYENEGYGMTISLSQFNPDKKYQNYAVFCQYRYEKDLQKYRLRMWLQHLCNDSSYKIEFSDIDTQYISGTRKTIRANICRIVDQAMKSSYFDHFIERFEFEIACCDKGIGLVEEERSAS